MRKIVLYVAAACVMTGLSGCPAMVGDSLLKSGQDTWAYILGILGAVLVIGGNPGAYATGSEIRVALTWLLGMISLIAGFFLGFS